MATIKGILPPGDYVTRDDVFVLDQHTLRSESGEKILDVTPQMLEKIAANQNRRTNDTGDATPLVIGHTRDGDDEQSQPEVVGYATGWKVKKFFKTGKLGLAATFHIFKRSVDKVRKYPRRSVELWVNTLTIDPISLLGATTPQRDLGLLKLSKDGSGSKIVASMDDSGELTVDENTQQIVDAVLEAIKSTDVWQFMENQMKEQGAEAESAGGAGDESPLGGGAPPGGEFDPSGEAGMLDALGGADAGGVPGMDDEAMQMSAAGAPAGGNTFAPGMGGEEEGPKKFSKISFQRMARENQEMKSTLNGLVLRYRRAEREKALMALEHEGYMLDKAEEIALCETLDDQQFNAHLQRVRLRYQKAPVGQLPYLEHSAQVNRGRSPNDVRSVVDTAIQMGISYEEALNRSSSARTTY
jgi:hypothetical protein